MEGKISRIPAIIGRLLASRWHPFLQTLHIQGCRHADAYDARCLVACLQDGLLSYTMRELANMPDDNPKWILLDGDLDANWVESMNSVMDDSRLLTLPSNERIRLLPHMKMIFEIRDLKYATPVGAWQKCACVVPMLLLMHSYP